MISYIYNENIYIYQEFDVCLVIKIWSQTKGQ